MSYSLCVYNIIKWVCITVLELWIEKMAENGQNQSFFFFSFSSFCDCNSSSSNPQLKFGPKSFIFVWNLWVFGRVLHYLGDWSSFWGVSSGMSSIFWQLFYSFFYCSATLLSLWNENQTPEPKIWSNQIFRFLFCAPTPGLSFLAPPLPFLCFFFFSIWFLLCWLLLLLPDLENLLGGFQWPWAPKERLHLYLQLLGGSTICFWVSAAKTLAGVS